jgi:oligoendopeptidase F
MKITSSGTLQFVAFLAFLSVVMQSARAASDASTPRSYTIDQTRYFATPEIERTELGVSLAEASNFPSTAPDEPKALMSYLSHAETLLARLQRHRAYLHLRASRDIDDRSALDSGGQAAAAIEQLLATVGGALRGIGRNSFARDVSAVPALKVYAYLLDQAEREASHQLPKDQQAILDEIAAPALADLWTLYEQTVRSTPFEKISTAEGELDAKKNALVLGLNSDRSIRQSAWQGRWRGYASREDIYATIILSVVRLEARQARLQHFEDAPSMVYFSRNLDRQNVTDALAAIGSHSELFKRYQRLRAEHVSAVTNMSDVHSWDLTLPAPGFSAPRLSLEQTSSTALLALKPLGRDYVEHFRQLLDPRNARLDVGAAQGKRTNGGFSIGVPGVPSGLFVENYGAGLLSDSRIIIHEGGHAIHRQLMNENKVTPFYTRGPNWMFEAFATLNEFLLYDNLYQRSTDPKAKVYYLEALIDDMTFNLFGSAEEGTLEQSLYDGIIAGRIKNAADFDALSMSIWSKYEIWPDLDPELAHTWMTKSLMVEDPLYLVNYLYAGLLATKLFDMSQRDPANFQKRYTDLLQQGFYAAPTELLHAFFGRDLSQQQLVDDSMDILQARIEALAKLYRKGVLKH